MAWIRLSDDYNDHPKFDALSDGAFRLWHQGMGFCRKFKTDGLIPMATVRKFKAFSPKRMTELLTPWQAGENGLWLSVDSFGVKVHDYLEWNLSKEEEGKEADGAAKRMRRLRAARRSMPSSTEQQTEQHHERSVNVPGWDGSLRSLEEKKQEISGSTRISPAPSDALAMRAGRLVERYSELFYEHRKGARLKVAPALDFDKALQLVKTWPDDGRLEKLAVIVLTTDDPWISNSGRGFGIFAAKASWADDRLAKWEAEHARTA